MEAECKFLPFMWQINALLVHWNTCLGSFDNLDQFSEPGCSGLGDVSVQYACHGWIIFVNVSGSEKVWELLA